MWAAETGSVSAAQVLLEYNVDINFKNNDGMTALHWAANNNHLDIVKLLLKYNANANIKDKNEKTPLDLAQEITDQSKFRQNQETITALLLSVTSRRYLVEEKSADVKAAEKNGDTPLHSPD
jgi:ankyrin repeat protein